MFFKLLLCTLFSAENVQALPTLRHGDNEGGGLQQDGVRRLRRLLVLAVRQGD
jgi:hypothetical protein